MREKWTEINFEKLEQEVFQKKNKKKDYKRVVGKKGL